MNTTNTTDHTTELLATIREALAVPPVAEQAERQEHTKRNRLLQTRSSAVIAATAGRPAASDVAFLREWIDRTPINYQTDEPTTA